MPRNSAQKKPNRTVRTRQHKSWWLEHYHAWQSSGLSKSDYCKQQGINRSSFANWTRRFDKEQTEQSPPSKLTPTFFEVVVPSQPSTIQSGQARSVTVNEITVAFDQPLNASDCLAWIKALQSC